MMLSSALQRSIRPVGSIETPTFDKFSSFKLPISKTQVFVKPNKSLGLHYQIQIKREKSFYVSAAAVAVEEATSMEDSVSTQTQKEVGVVLKPIPKPRLVLKFIWIEKNIGLAIDQVIPGHGTIPLSPYYFWPRKDAWEELKVLLEAKPWISQKQMIILLNQATDIINLWQQSGGDLS